MIRVHQCHRQTDRRRDDLPRRNRAQHRAVQGRLHWEEDATCIQIGRAGKNPPTPDLTISVASWCISGLWMLQNAFAVGALPRIPLRELTLLPRPSSWWNSPNPTPLSAVGLACRPFGPQLQLWEGWFLLVEGGVQRLWCCKNEKDDNSLAVKLLSGDIYRRFDVHRKSSSEEWMIKHHFFIQFLA